MILLRANFRKKLQTLTDSFSVWYFILTKNKNMYLNRYLFYLVFSCFLSGIIPQKVLGKHTPVINSTSFFPLKTDTIFTYHLATDYRQPKTFRDIPEEALREEGNKDNSLYSGCSFYVRNESEDSCTFYVYHYLSDFWVVTLEDANGKIIYMKEVDRYALLKLNVSPFEQSGVKITLPPSANYKVRLWNRKAQETLNSTFYLFSEEGFFRRQGIRLFKDNYLFLFEMLLTAILFFQMTISIFQWFLVKRLEYVWYAFYLGGLFIYYGNRLEGKYNLDVFFNFNLIPNYLLGGFLSLVIHYFYFRFARYYLALPERQPDLNRKIILAEYFILLFAMLLLVIFQLGYEFTAQVFFYLISIFLFGLAVYFIVKVFRSRNPLAKYLLIGALFALSGNALSIITSILIVSGNAVVNDAVFFSQVGTMIEVVFFNIALLYKTRNTEIEKLISQEALIKELQKNEKLRNHMQQIRDKISQDLHDDIGATLSSIKIYSEVAQKQWTENPRKVLELLHRINLNATTILDSMGDIVWSINPKRDKLDDIHFKMNTFLHEVLDVKNIPFSLNTSVNLKSISLGMNTRKNIFLIFKEAVNNISKYSEATQVTITLHVENECFSMEISDNGIGFDIHKMNRQNGLGNMRKRTEELGGTFRIISEINKGTHIYCEIPNIREA